MAKFIKHVGKHGDRKVAVVFREIPGEEHMCLVAYTELLNQNIHDPLMSAIESPQGQAAKNLADELNRAYTRDGKIILQVLHAEGMLKKAQTSQVVMTPAPGQSIRLNELNSLLDEMEKGEDAVRRLAEIDASRGMQDPKDIARRMRDNTVQATPTRSNPGALDDSAIANNLRAQATRMSNEAKGLMAEADRLLKEAAQLEGVVTSTPTNSAAAAMKATKKPGRTKKTAVTG